MPNWVHNSVHVQGKKERVEEFRKKHFSTEKNQGKKGNEEFDFETIIPMPDTVFKGNLGTKEREEHGSNNWYDWSIDNWGTKWNACHTDLYSDKIEISGPMASFGFNFDTAWALPMPIYEKLRDMYPDLYISVDFDEESGEFAGELEITDGSILQLERDPTEGWEVEPEQGDYE